jgi:hypothetical protein
LRNAPDDQFPKNPGGQRRQKGNQLRIEIVDIANGILLPTGMDNYDLADKITNKKPFSYSIDRSKVPDDDRKYRGKKYWYEVKTSDGRHGWTRFIQESFEVTVRSFIPSPILGIVPTKAPPSRLTFFGGDGRSFVYDTENFRCSMRTRIGHGDMDFVDANKLSWGSTKEYDSRSCARTTGKPFWWHHLVHADKPINEVTLAVTPENLQIQNNNAAGQSGLGGGLKGTTFKVSGGDPLVPIAPKIDAAIQVQLSSLEPRSDIRFSNYSPITAHREQPLSISTSEMEEYDDSYFLTITGTHDGFPSFEIFLGKTLVYD